MKKSRKVKQKMTYQRPKIRRSYSGYTVPSNMPHVSCKHYMQPKNWSYVPRLNDPGMKRTQNLVNTLNRSASFVPISSRFLPGLGGIEDLIPTVITAKIDKVERAGQVILVASIIGAIASTANLVMKK